MHECLLCERDMKKAKTIFGTGCLKSIYKLLDLEIPKNIKNKESYLIKKIMKELNVKNLNEQQKVWLADRYLTHKIISGLKFGNYEDLKQDLESDIANIEQARNFSELKTADKLKLKNAYNMRKRENKLDDVIKDIQEVHKKSKNINIQILLGIVPSSFSVKKNTNQIEANGIVAIQRILWKVVVTGGRIVGFDNSADFLEHSLNDEAEDLIITEGAVVDEIKNDAQFQEKIKEVVKKYGKDSDEFIASGEDANIHFNNSDLYFAIHSASTTIKGKKSNGKWNLEIEMEDTYDYTDFKEITDYFYDTNSISKSMFSSILYNLAYFSVKFKGIDVYKINIKFNINDYEVE